jgi:hypothetical protein
MAKKHPKKLPVALVLADSIGAILISVYILVTWIRQANRKSIDDNSFIIIFL